MKKAILPGSFDPITCGHIDLIKRACNIFDQIIVLVANNDTKNYLLSYKERYDLVKEVVLSLDFSNVVVDKFKGFIADYANKKSIDYIIRGVRAFHDFDIEFEMYLINKQINPKVDTILLPSTSQNLIIRSSLIQKLIRKNDFNFSGFIPDLVSKKLRNKFVDKLD